MRYLKASVIIFGITVAGELLSHTLPLPVPAGVYGLFILLAFLCGGIVKTEDVSVTGDFLMDIMPLMFVPAGAGLLNSIDELKSIFLPLTVITAVSTIFVMVATGWVAQYMIQKPGWKSGGSKEQ